MRKDLDFFLFDTGLQIFTFFQKRIFFCDVYNWKKTKGVYCLAFVNWIFLFTFESWLNIQKSKSVDCVYGKQCSKSQESVKVALSNEINCSIRKNVSKRISLTIYVFLCESLYRDRNYTTLYTVYKQIIYAITIWSCNCLSLI